MHAASTAKKQRQLEVQIAELKSQLAVTKSTTNTTNNNNNLVADVKAQLSQAEAEVQSVKNQLHTERYTF